VVAAGVYAVAVPAASAYPSADVTLTGHGWGPGTGMGQWGALGDALAQTSYTQILSDAYGTLAGGGTTSIGTLPDGWSDGSTPVKVAVTANAGNTVIVTSGSPFTVTGTADTFGPGGTYGAVMFQIATGTSGLWNVFGATGCAGPSWSLIETDVSGPTASPVTAAPFPTAPGPGLDAELLQLCQGGGNLYARGSFEGVTNSAGQPRTVDIVALGQYVADVTPSESPVSWGALGAAGPQGEPWGFQELEAQAVASRSYVMSTYGALQGYFGYADICDTSCQSYPGVANENALTDTAVTDTSDTVVLMPGGTVAQTQYSSSTGGYSAPGTFAAEPDPQDAVCVAGACNPHHSWQAQIPVAAVESAYPQIGTLISVGVSQRNGLGDLGGRVVEMTVQGSAGNVSVTGNAFAAQFAADGVQSNWFAVTSQPSGGVGGYWMAAADGGVFAFGNAGFDGSMGGTHLNAPVVGIAATPDAGGYWLAAGDGGIFSFGDAGFHGSMGGTRLNDPVVGVAATTDGAGYWEVASDGGIFSFGDAGFHGSMGGTRLNDPVVGMAVTPDGAGYWEVASDGGIFSFGDAGFHGSLGATHLNAPVVGMAAAPDGGGYWLVAADGGVFAFGDAGYEGSLPGIGLHAPGAALLATHTGLGYLVLGRGGQAVDFGDAPQFGDVTTAVPGWTGTVVGGATASG
jgi:SpoIID/LytB domain protein